MEKGEEENKGFHISTLLPTHLPKIRRRKDEGGRKEGGLRARKFPGLAIKKKEGKKKKRKPYQAAAGGRLDKAGGRQEPMAAGRQESFQEEGRENRADSIGGYQHTTKEGRGKKASALQPASPPFFRVAEGKRRRGREGRRGKKAGPASQLLFYNNITATAKFV